MAQSHLEAQFNLIVRAAELPEPETEVKFHESRRWRFDFAWPDAMVAVEIEGGTWSRGRHTRGSGFIADCDKYNAAAVLGWRVLRFTGEHLNDPDAVVAILHQMLTTYTKP